MSPSKAHTSVYFEEHSNASVRFDELAPPLLLLDDYSASSRNKKPPLPLSLGNLKNGGAMDATIASTKYTQYAGMKRLPKIPDVRVKKIKHKGIKKTFTNLANGKCAGVVNIDKTINTLSLQIESTDISLPESLRGVIFGITFVQGHEDGLTICIPYGTCALFFEGTSQEQQREVIYRCMHMFLRSYGHWVALESFEVFVSTCNTILASWNETKRYALALDIATVLADVTILQRPSEGRRILHYIHTVAEYLEANGNMNDAAHMYLGLDEFCAKDRPELECLANAGLAFKYSGDHAMAESMYVRVFHILYTFGVTIHNPEHHGIVSNVYYLYKGLEGKRKGDGLAINNDQESLVVIYGDLLKAAKYKSTDVNFNEEIDEWGNPLNLKCELQNADAATAVLNNLGSEPDSDLFRKKLLACTDNRFYTWNGGKDDTFEEFQKFHKKNIRKQTRTSFWSGYHENCDNNGCGANQMADGQKLLQCPCRTVYYCGKKCQKAHWKVHKKYCPHFAKIQRTKKNGGAGGE